MSEFRRAGYSLETELDFYASRLGSSTGTLGTGQIVYASTLDLYALLSGRPGTANHLTICTDGTGRINGSSASGGQLDLYSTSHSTQGAMNLYASQVNFVGPSGASRELTINRSGDGSAFRIRKSDSSRAEFFIGSYQFFSCFGDGEIFDIGLPTGPWYTGTNRLWGQTKIEGANTYTPSYRPLLIVRGISGMTADLTQWQNISETVLARVKSTGEILCETTGGIGYAGTTAGGSRTQGTSKSTGMTLDKVCGQITMHNAALAANTSVSFTLSNSACRNTDVMILNHVSGGTLGAYTLNAACGDGSATITVRNVTGGSLSEAIVIRFAIIRSSV